MGAASGACHLQGDDLSGLVDAARPAAQVTQTDPSVGRRRSRLWPSLLLSLATVAVMLPLMEVAVRVVAPQRVSWLAIYRHHPALPTYSYQANAQTTVDTGESRWTVHTDDRGFRVAQQPEGEDDRPVVLWLGDSFTFGYAVNYEDSFVGTLARDPQGCFHHMNAAVGGHGPTQYRQMLEYLLGSGLKPRVVVVGTFLGNDFLDCIANKDIPVKDGILGNEGGVKSFLKQHFHLYRLGTRALHVLRPAGLEGDGQDGDQASARAWVDGSLHDADLVFRREFARMAELCRTSGIEMAVLILPWGPMVEAVAKGTAETPDHRIDRTLPLKHALSALQDLHIRYLDLTPILIQHPVGETYFAYDAHFTPRGHALVAMTVRREWSDLLLEP